MKSTGIVRKLDELGRITLPIELRRTLGFSEREPIEILVEDGKVILQKYNAKAELNSRTDKLRDDILSDISNPTVAVRVIDLFKEVKELIP
jgi:transcriptional pleiotropic regulator of transition state genes